MPRKHKYPNNEESPIHDVDVDPFDDDNVSQEDVSSLETRVVNAKMEKLNVDKEVDKILAADPKACVCSVRRNLECRTHKWSDRNK